MPFLEGEEPSQFFSYHSGYPYRSSGARVSDDDPAASGGIVTVESVRERSTAAMQSISLDALCAGACRAVGARQALRRRASSKGQQSYPCPLPTADEDEYPLVA